MNCIYFTWLEYKIDSKFKLEYQMVIGDISNNNFYYILNSVTLTIT